MRVGTILLSSPTVSELWGPLEELVENATVYKNKLNSEGILRWLESLLLGQWLYQILPS